MRIYLIKYKYLIYISVFVIFSLISCNPDREIGLKNNCLDIKSDIKYIPYSIGEKCTVMWDKITNSGAKYEIILLYYELGPNCQLMKKGQEEPKTVYNNEYSFFVKSGITVISVRTIITTKSKVLRSRWAYSNNQQYVADHKPWAIISISQ